MRLTSCYPVLCTARLAESSRFYRELFGFRPTFESDWYVSLERPGPVRAELALVDCRHPTIPQGFRVPVRGLLVNLEVEDVEAEWARLVLRGGLRPELPLRDEDFGQRHFIVADPDGALVDVITPIAPSAEYARQYTPA
ncbi:VOC family protein [Geodermatophilus sp. SYSU D01119]